MTLGALLGARTADRPPRGRDACRHRRFGSVHPHPPTHALIPTLTLALTLAFTPTLALALALTLTLTLPLTLTLTLPLTLPPASGELPLAGP